MFICSLSRGTSQGTELVSLICFESETERNPRMPFFVRNHREGHTKIICNIPVTTDKLIYEIVINYVIFNRAQYVLNPPTGTELEWFVAKLIKIDNIFCQLFINKGNNKITELRTILQRCWYFIEVFICTETFTVCLLRDDKTVLVVLVLTHFPQSTVSRNSLSYSLLGKQCGYQHRSMWGMVWRGIS